MTAIFSFHRWGLPVLAILMMLVAVARAEPVVTASVSQNTVSVGEPVMLTISVQGEGQMTLPREITVEGLDIQYSGQQQSMRMENFSRYTASKNLLYTIQTDKPGTYTIPPIELQANGKVYRTEPIQLTVQAATEGGQPGNREIAFAEITLPKTTAYVGETLPVELRLYVEANIRWQAEQMPVFQGEGFTKQKIPEPRREQAKRGGKEYEVIVFRTAVTPGKAGKISIGPSEIQIQAQVPQARRKPRRSPLEDLFGEAFSDDPFFQPSQVKRFPVKAPAVELEIAPLPAAGRPKDFSGAVGNFKFAAAGTPGKVKVGDPITMSLTVSGRGNFDRVNEPSLKAPEGWHPYPASTDFKPDDDLGISGTKVFEMAVIPETKKTSMPVFGFSFFNPEAGKYQTLVNTPSPLEVDDAGSVNPTPIQGSPKLEQPAIPHPASKPVTADIVGLRYDFGSERDSFEPLYLRKTFQLAQCIPGGILAAFLCLRLRRTDEKAARQATLRREIAQMRTRLLQENSRTVFFETAARILQLDTAIKTGRPEHHIDAASVCAAGKPDESQAARVEEIFNARAELLYAGSGPSSREASISEGEREQILNTIAHFEGSHGNS